jgi:hypothetical protein
MTLPVRAQRRPATESTLADVEQRLRAPLPGEYRKFLLDHDGLTLRYNNVEGHDDLSVRMFYNAEGGNQFSLRRNATVFAGRKPDGLLPIADDSYGNQFLLSLRGSDYGSVWFWDHELEDDDDLDGALTFVASGFGEFVAAIRPDETDPAEYEGHGQLIYSDPDLDEEIRRTYEQWLRGE